MAPLGRGDVLQFIRSFVTIMPHDRLCGELLTPAKPWRRLPLEHYQLLCGDLVTLTVLFFLQVPVELYLEDRHKVLVL